MDAITNWERLIGIQTRDGQFYSRDDIALVYRDAEDYMDGERRWVHFCEHNAGRAVAWDIAHIKHCPNCGAAPK